MKKKDNYRTSDNNAPDVPGYVFDTDEYARKLREKEKVVKEEPSFILDIPDGERLYFFVDKHDSGVALLGQIDGYPTRHSVLDHPDLQEATPAMIYHAVTEDDSNIPEVLVTHHEGVAREFGLVELEVALKGRERGWLLGEPPSQQPAEPCVNVTFDANICDHPAYDEALCKIDTSATWIWIVPGAYRYKAGFCLQTGQALSWLTYTHTRWNNQDEHCESCGVLHIFWGFNSLLFGEKWSAPTYLVHYWWKSAGSTWARKYSHVAGYGSGAVFDWGQRYSWQPCQFFD